MSVEQRNFFREVVEHIFNRWTALKLSVEHGMGGTNGLQTAIEIVAYVTNCCIDNPKVTEENLIDLLEEIMDQEFETICDDNSPKEISYYLMKYLNLLKIGKEEDIKKELSEMTPCSMWINPNNKINYILDSDNEESVSGDDDDEMEAESQPAAPSTSGSTMKFVEEVEADPGWTMVKTKRKK